MRRGNAGLGLLLLVLVSGGCSRPPGIFSEPNARAHVGMLAGTIGSRPIGTPANARARDYIIDQLRLFGFEVRVQEADARRAPIGLTARVSNVIAVRPGRRPEAIGIVSHYDSVPAGPGAADDALGVGVSLEAARVLAARADRNWTLMVLVTDGEEAGLMGAAALITDREVTSRLQAYVNLEAIGSAGGPMLFETGPGNGWLVRPWARSAPAPRGASFGIEIYRHLPNDTDFSILKRQGIPGLNFAAIDDSYAYHTPRDTPERLSSSTIRRTGEQVVSIVTALDAVDVTERSASDRTFFDVLGLSALSYSPGVGIAIALLALPLGIVAWVRVIGAAIRIEGLLRWLLTAFWTLAGSAAVIAAMVGATWALRLAREVYHPWYARPGRLFLLLLAVGVTVAWSSARLGRWLPKRAHGLRHPLVAWSLALPVWIAIASAMISLAPGAAYLWLLPLFCAGLLLSILPVANVTAVRTASAVVFIVTAALWLRHTIDLLHFVVAIFGRLPIVTPVFVYAAVMAAAGVMLVPPLVATITKVRPFVRPSLETALCLFAVAATAGFAYRAPGYTHEEPLRRVARAVQDGDGPATWDVGSTEPGIDLAEGAPSGWTAAGAAPTASIPVRRLPHPFVFRSTGPSLGPAPIAIAALTVAPVTAGTELTVTVVPRHPGLAISFVLPEGVAPARSNLPGIPRLGHWTATYIAPPPDGLVFRATFGSPDAARLRDLRVVATALGPGDGSGWQPPAWLPQSRTAWTAEASWIVAPFALPIAPVPPLR
jgi:Peptidase family M28